MLFGILGAIALGGCTPVWMLGQMGGPSPFGYVWLLAGGSALLLAMFFVKTRTIMSAVICGLIFSIPIAAFCWILPTSDPHLDYFKEMRGEAVATVIGSVVLLVCATFMRQLSQPSLGADDSAEPDASPNGGPGKPPADPVATEGPPSVS